MMGKVRLNIVLVLSILFVHFRAYVQVQEDDDLQTQEITVVKSYKPSLAKFFKIRSSPIIVDSLLEDKVLVNYNHISVPVIYTFVPNKASPLKLQKQEASIIQNTKGHF